VVGLYLAASASEPPAPGQKPNAVRTIERRLPAIAWNCAQRGQPLDRADRHIAEVMRGIRRRHARRPDQKEAVLADDLLRMIATLSHDLRGLRDRAILLIGFAGGLRRSEITGLDCGPDHTEDGAGWIEFLDQGVLIRVRGKTGWRALETLAEAWPHRPWAAVPADREGRQGGWVRPAHRQARRPAGQAHGSGRRGPGRPLRRRTAPEVLRPFVARRPRHRRAGR
jgi:integrase